MDSLGILLIHKPWIHVEILLKNFHGYLEKIPLKIHSILPLFQRFFEKILQKFLEKLFHGFIWRCFFCLQKSHLVVIKHFFFSRTPIANPSKPLHGCHWKIIQEFVSDILGLNFFRYFSKDFYRKYSMDCFHFLGNFLRASLASLSRFHFIITSVVQLLLSYYLFIIIIIFIINSLL